MAQTEPSRGGKSDDGILSYEPSPEDLYQLDSRLTIDQMHEVISGIEGLPRGRDSREYNSSDDEIPRPRWANQKSNRWGPDGSKMRALEKEWKKSFLATIKRYNFEAATAQSANTERPKSPVTDADTFQNASIPDTEQAPPTEQTPSNTAVQGEALN
jgi:hypothetical protein